MSNWVAFHWDKNQLLILTARNKKGKLFLEKAVRIFPELKSNSDSGPDVSAAKSPAFTNDSVRESLHKFVQQERLGKYDTVAVLGRDDVEVRSMIFPSVPNDELPDMARFQAPKDFTEYDASALLDFVLFDGARKDKKHILASVLTKAKFDATESIATGAGLDLQRIVLGPCESAQRFATITVQQKTGGAGKTTLLVEMGEISASLVLLYRGKPAFVRTAHFQKPVWAELEKTRKEQFDSPDELDNWKWFTSEFKRTIVAAINEVPSEKIDEIVLCGVGERFEKLLRLLETSLALPVSLFNVWRFETRDGEIGNHLPVFEEQFLPLIGALHAASNGKPNAMDFKNPKRKPEKKSNRNLVTALVAMFALFFLLFLGWGFYRRVTLEGEIQLLNTERTGLEIKAAKAEQLKYQTTALENWEKENINWLSELNWLSTNMPESQDAILTGLTLQAPAIKTKVNATMKFDANTHGSVIIPAMEEKLRDETHQLRSTRLAPINNQGMYTHVVKDMTVTIFPKTPPKLTQPKPALATSPKANEIKNGIKTDKQQASGQKTGVQKTEELKTETPPATETQESDKPDETKLGKAGHDGAGHDVLQENGGER